MITEDYVSFETAKLLKKKGFDEATIGYYNTISEIPEKIKFFNSQISIYDSDGLIGCIQAPTLQMAMKWLREKQIFITIGFCDYPTLHKSEWIPEVCTHDSIFDEPSIAYSTYEEACEAAIKYCLENLI